MTFQTQLYELLPVSLDQVRHSSSSNGISGGVLGVHGEVMDAPWRRAETRWKGTQFSTNICEAQ